MSSTTQTMSNQVDQLINHGIRKLVTAGPTHNWWCIHCNKFLPADGRYDAEHHASMCPYQALAACHKWGVRRKNVMANVADILTAFHNPSCPKYGQGNKDKECQCRMDEVIEELTVEESP